MNPAILLDILRFGPGAVDLAFRLKAIVDSNVTTLSQADWETLKTTYGTKTADQYLAEAGGAPTT